MIRQDAAIYPFFSTMPLDGVPHVLAPVDGFLYIIIKLGPLHHFQRRGFSFEKVAGRGMVHIVTNALKAVDLDQHVFQLRQLARLAKPMNRFA